MKTSVTRLTITRQKGQALGEHHGDQKLAQSQLIGAKKATTKAQAAAELAAFKRDIGKLSTRQLQQLHSRLSKRLGSLALAKMMKEAKR